MSKCKKCKAPIIWTETEATAKKPGRNMPVDADPDRPGKALVVDGANLVFTGARSGNGAWIVRYVPKGKGRHVSHFATCPFASSFRKR